VKPEARRITGRVFLEEKTVLLDIKGKLKGVIGKAWVPMWVEVLGREERIRVSLCNRQARFYRRMAVGGYVQVVVNGLLLEEDIKELHRPGWRVFRDGAMIYQVICPSRQAVAVVDILKARGIQQFVVIHPREILKYSVR